LEGYLDVDLILNCNKIKQLSVNKEDIINAIKLSTELELDSTGTRFRRNGNKALPELKMLAKKTKREDDDGDDVDEKNDNKESKEERSFDPVILELHSDKEVEFKWKPIQDEFKSLNPNLNVVYLRFSDKSGHIGLYKYKNQELKFVETMTVEGVTFTIKKM